MWPLDSLRLAQQRIAVESIRFSLIAIASLQVFLSLQVTVLNEYFGVDTLASLSWLANDGWCRSENRENIGVHCFGDYAYVHGAIEAGKFWEPPYNFGYPAAAFAPAAVSLLAGEWLGSYSAGLFIYLFFLIISLSSMWLGLVAFNRNFQGAEKFIALFSIGPLSLPALVALDRGNTVGFFVPGLLMLIVGILVNDHRFLIAGVVFGSLLKPQFSILILIFLFRRDWRNLLVAAALITVGHVFAYLILVGEVISPLKKTFLVAIDFSGDAGGAPLEKNISIAGAVSQLARSWDYWLVEESKLVALILITTLLVWSSLLGNRMSEREQLTILLVVAMVGTPVAFSYYLLFAQATILLWSHSEGESKFSIRSGWGRWVDLRTRIPRALVLTASVISLTAVLFPWQTLGTRVGSSQWIPSLLWLIVIIILPIQATASARRRPRNQ